MSSELCSDIAFIDSIIMTFPRNVLHYLCIHSSYTVTADCWGGALSNSESN